MHPQVASQVLPAGRPPYLKPGWFVGSDFLSAVDLQSNRNADLAGDPNSFASA